MISEFWELFVRQYGGLRAGLTAFVVTAGLSFLEAVNVSFLIPIVELVQSSEEGSEHWVSRAFSRLFESVGLPYELWSLLLAFGALLIVISAIKYLRMVLVARMITDFTVWMRSWMMDRLLHSSMAFFHGQNHAQGKLADTLTTQVTRASATSGAIADICTSITMVIAFLTAAFIITPTLTAITLGMLVIVGLLIQFLITRARILAAAQVQRELELQAVGLENLNGINVVKSFLLERLRGLAFTDKARQSAEIGYKLQLNRGQIVILHEIALFGFVGIILLLGVSILHLSISPIVALLFILYRLMPRIAGFNTQRQSLLATMASLHAAKVVADSAMEAQIISGETHFTELNQSIEFNQVSFSYNGSAKVLNGTQLTIAKGKMTAIMGSSGTGKSTIVSLLLRHYDPVDGQVLIDGVDLKDLDLPSWRDSIAVVSQDIFLFNDTIINNIEMGRPGASRETILEATRKAYAHDFIEALPDKYETQVGDRGWNLSGGERQRIALARAILKEPQIMILDEATSSLDSESERLIQDYIREIRGTCTLITIAHRTSTVQDADKIVVIQDGCVVEEGNWHDLLAGEGVFANYQRLQSSTDRR